MRSGMGADTAATGVATVTDWGSARETFAPIATI